MSSSLQQNSSVGVGSSRERFGIFKAHNEAQVISDSRRGIPECPRKHYEEMKTSLNITFERDKPPIETKAPKRNFLSRVFYRLRLRCRKK